MAINPRELGPELTHARLLNVHSGKVPPVNRRAKSK
jgi:hypothetical protein